MRPLQITDDPNHALELLNNHDHSTGLGKPITTEGLADEAVTSEKIADKAVINGNLADQAVDGRTIKENSISLKHFTSDVAFAGGAYGIKNYISQGLNIVPQGGLDVKVTKGKCNINEYQLSVTGDQTITLPKNQAGLLYAVLNDGDIEPEIGVLPARLPQPSPGVTLVRYVFDKKVNDLYISDSSGNGNDMTIYGAVNLVDGITGNALQFDGATGYAEAKNTVALPAGNADKHLDIVFSVAKPKVDQFVCCMSGAAGTSYAFARLRVLNQRFHIDFYSTSYDTGIHVLADKVYYVAAKYNNRTVKVFVNGSLVFIQNYVDLATVATSKPFIGRNAYGSYWSNVTMYYYELRNQTRADEEIAQISNALCLPVEYLDQRKQYPVMPTGADFPDYSQWCGSNASDLEDTGNRAVKNPVTVNGTMYAVQSPFGQSLDFRNNIANYLDCGDISLGNEWTIIAILEMRPDGGGRFAGSLGTTGMILSTNESVTNKANIYVNSAYFVSEKSLNWNDINFIVYKYSNGILKMCVNDFVVNQHHVTTIAPRTFPLTIGRAWNTSYPFNGTMHYFAVFDKELSEMQLRQIYESTFIPAKFKDIRELLPANALGIGYFRTNRNSVIEYDDQKYKWGRRQGAILGNRKAFTGWEYVTTSQVIPYRENPFGTARIKTTIFANQYAPTFNRAYLIDSIYSSGSYGSWVSDITNDFIKIVMGGSAVMWAHEKSAGAGWLNVLMEVIED